MNLELIRSSVHKRRNKLRGVLFTVLGLAISSFGQQQVPSQPHPRVQQANKPTAKEQPAPSPVVITKPEIQPEPKGKAEECGYLQKIHDYLKKSIAPEYLSNWMLFLAAAVGVGFAWSTLETLIKQTKLTKIAADAGKASADAALAGVQAVIDSERSWIIGIVPDDNDTVNLFGHPAHIPKCSIGIRNAGRTPGKVTTFCLRFEKMNSLSDLEQEPQFGVDSRKSLGNHMIFPSETPIWVTMAIEGEKALSQEERVAATEKRLYLVCWGEIIYEDVLKKDHHMTRFCYFYTHWSRSFQTCLDAPASYRQTT